MRIKTPNGVKAVEREEFLKKICEAKQDIDTILKRSNNELKFYGGLVKRGYSLSDLDIGIANFERPGYDEIKEVISKITAACCLQCNIHPSLNAMAFGNAVIHIPYSDIATRCDNLEAYQKAFDTTIDAFKQIEKDSKIHKALEPELERVIDEVTTMCSEEANIKDALDCHRTQLHSKREPLGYEIEAITYKVTGRERPIKVRD